MKRRATARRASRAAAAAPRRTSRAGAALLACCVAATCAAAAAAAPARVAHGGADPLAFVQAGALRVWSPDDGHIETLARGAAGDVSVAPDARHVAWIRCRARAAPSSASASSLRPGPPTPRSAPSTELAYITAKGDLAVRSFLTRQDRIVARGSVSAVDW